MVHLLLSAMDDCYTNTANIDRLSQIRGLLLYHRPILHSRSAPMLSILLAVIYVAFISLGLPDAILGSAWPSMYKQLNVPVSYAGIISMIIAGGTIISSLMSEKIIRRLGTGIVTMASVALTAVALLGFSFSGAFWQLCLCAIPYGLGAGSVDAALNNFVALHYRSRHMNWLHCFWGVGAATGPVIMGLCLSGGLQWNSGYQVIGLIQLALVVGLIFTLPLWKADTESGAAASDHERHGMKSMLKLPGVKPVLAAFFCYCALETTAGLWASSYMVLSRGVAPEAAAKMASLFFLGITIGRFLSGFVSGKLGDRKMIRLGQALAAVGIAIILLPLRNSILYIGLMVTGLGCAPIFPSLLHATPTNFGAANSQTIMGMQMACAYTGTTFIPPLFGFLAERLTVGIYPIFLLIFAAGMLFMAERLNRKHAKQGASEISATIGNHHV
jgi:fucose permease